MYTFSERSLNVLSENVNFMSVSSLALILSALKSQKLSQHTSLHLRTTVPFVTAHLEIFHCTHHPMIPKSDLYFTFCSTLNALSKRTSK